MTSNTYTYLDETLSLRTTHFKQKCLFVFITLFCFMLLFHFYCDRELLLLNRNLRIFTFRSKFTIVKYFFVFDILLLSLFVFIFVKQIMLRRPNSPLII